MKFIQWNVNGLRACVQKGFLDFFNSIDADFFCIQESKLQAGQIDLDLPGYHQYWNYAEKKGYSGTAIFAKNEPLCVSYGIGIEERYFYPDAEGIYSWWSYRFKAREKNAGWRIDYFITSKRINDKLQKAAIHTDVLGSDHCPVEVDIEF